MAAAASWASYPNPTTNKVYRVAVIGHTNRGNYGHGLDTLWKNIPECKVIAVADQVEEGLTKAKQRLGNIPGYSNYVQMLKDTKPDIVSIAPRHIDQHYTMVLASAEAGVKGIYLEKPFCRNLMEAQQIVDLCRAKNIKLALAHRNRYLKLNKLFKKVELAGLWK
jgi:predicted dehydrogenase